MALRSVNALSLDRARGLRPRVDTLLISILGKQESMNKRRPALGGWRSVLVMEFEDVSEESVMAKPGDWPLAPTEEDSERILGRDKGHLPSITHARQIVEFLSKHHACEEDLNLVVHCHACVSRSVMVASKAAQWCNLETPEDLENRLAYANKRLGRLMELARMECDPDAVLGDAKRKPSARPN